MKVTSCPKLPGAAELVTPVVVASWSADWLTVLAVLLFNCELPRKTALIEWEPTATPVVTKVAVPALSVSVATSIELSKNST